MWTKSEAFTLNLLLVTIVINVHRYDVKWFFISGDGQLFSNSFKSIKTCSKEFTNHSAEKPRIQQKKIELTKDLQNMNVCNVNEWFLK